MNSRQPRADIGILPPLPAAYAFVVRLGRESDPAQGRFIGQVEHLTSGRQGRFSSREEMLVFLEQTLTAALADPNAHEP